LWNHAAAQHSSFYFPWEKKANTYAAKAQWDAAVEAYEKALALDSGNDRLFYNAALAYFQLGNKEKAKACYREAIVLNPEVFYYYINLARLYFEETKVEEAKGLLLESHRLAPDNAQVNLTLAQFAMETGQLDPCPYLKKAVELGEKIPPGVFENFCE
jgi:superkiller protein 3